MKASLNKSFLLVALMLLSACVSNGAYQQSYEPYEPARPEYATGYRDSHGREQGMWTVYYGNGRKASEIDYVNGYLNGNIKFFCDCDSAAPITWSTGQFRNGTASGKFEGYDHSDPHYSSFIAGKGRITRMLAGDRRYAIRLFNVMLETGHKYNRIINHTRGNSR